MTLSVPQIEAFVLGTIIGHQRKTLNAMAFGILDKEDFYDPTHSAVYTALLELYAQGSATDLLSLLATHRELNAHTLTALVEAAYTTDENGFQSQLLILKEYRMKRELVEVLGVSRDLYYSGPKYDVFDAIDAITTKLKRIIPPSERLKSIGTTFEMDEVVAESFATAEEKNKGTILTGFPTLDTIIGGIRRGDLVVVASRPSMGKTAFSLSYSLNQLAARNGVGFFSLEMRSKALLNRALSQITGVASSRLRFSTLSKDEQDHIRHMMENCPHDFDFMPIDDDGGMTIDRMRARLDQWRGQKNIRSVVVDYLQLIKPTGKDVPREQQISEISRSLKRIAKEFDVAMIALAQLSRAAEAAARPQLAHLRESGAIEQDADMVMFLYRPEYYGHESYPSGRSTRGIGEVIVAKNRDGAVGTAMLGYDKEKTMWYDMEGSEPMFHDPFAN